MIAFERVTKSFGTGRIANRAPLAVHALRDVSLVLPRGGVHAVVGPNGAGKSTLLALLLGFLHPSAGDVRIDDDDPAVYVRRHGAGYLPERFALPPQWRVRDALSALARLAGGADAGRSVQEALDRYELGAHAGKEVGTLSRGTLQRVGLAQAFLPARMLLVLDEPTEGLDPIWRIRFRDSVAAARARGATVILASHDLAEVERLADRAVLLEDGSVRDVLDTRNEDEPRAYLLRLVAPSAAVPQLFPDAAQLPDATATYRVDIASAAELSGRLAALLATGAHIAAVQPVTEPFEERVRRALSEP